ncbi:hypothetical protein [Staphylococcus capitis]|uniref:hypothetical protein n=1 Tax=Staphylococcus capitis TaxID=29388 RepID=UPI0020032551|nr:hypothetical protein [Staphylococcus capitis]
MLKLYYKFNFATEPSEISPSFLLNLDPNEVKKVLDNKKIDYQETPYKDVKTYL